MSKKETDKPEPEEQDPDAMSLPAKIGAFLLLILLAVYLIFFSELSA